MTAKRLMPADGAAGIKRETQDFVRSSLLPTNSPPPPQIKGVARQNLDKVQALIRRWQYDGDKAALDRLCLLCQPMVKAEVRKWWPSYAGKRSKTASRDQEARLDIEQAAWVGFVKTVDRYKAQYGAKLSIYARWWIRDELRQTSTKHIAYCRVGSLNQPSGGDGDGDGDELIDLIPDPDALSPEVALLRQQTAKLVDAALAKLDSRARRILLARNSSGPLTRAEIAAELGLSNERVRQIEAKARGKIAPILERSFGGQVPTITETKLMPEGCRKVGLAGGCDLDDGTDPAHVTLKTGKSRKVARAKAASEVRQIEVTTEISVLYAATYDLWIKRYKRPFWERAIDTPGAAKIFPLPAGHGTAINTGPAKLTIKTAGRGSR
jgi:RNA polymerase sigma factor (sigma-70 family)